MENDRISSSQDINSTVTVEEIEGRDAGEVFMRVGEKDMEYKARVRWPRANENERQSTNTCGAYKYLWSLASSKEMQ